MILHDCGFSASVSGPLLTRFVGEGRKTSSVEVTYGVVWREGGAEEAGRLLLGHGSISFTDFEFGDAIKRRVTLDEIRVAELRRTESDSHRASVVLTLRNGRQVEIESAAEAWIMISLVENVVTQILTAAGRRRHILLAVRLKPGCLDAARERLREGPPFDPARTRLVFHDVFLLEDEVLFVFETDGTDRLEQLLDFDAWDLVAKWSELLTGEVRLAESAYSWARTDAVDNRADGPMGLGF